MNLQPYFIIYLIVAGIIVIFVVAHARLRYDKRGVMMQAVQALLTYAIGTYGLAGGINSVPKLIVVIVLYAALAFFLERAKKRYVKSKSK
ncbi:MAG: hypothetical protein A2898_03110 [Candidatus Kerfeldbacteria bacterium RIFCSPLOWO2_01_FULL_48_11]|uniref:Uncharacterized protein n=1 Tax=Candidatus Kerfeldbacteria bacterium RIFCSPLOWO2_01_FULL_48_11 TaxID=1798543 RepID=A0A1G2B543_9BACT|nr:MAG: hypothetical protein UY34_C0027G0007 [Parcubacteria group bacterium GW2011_GWA2_48_9]OGY84292.1 MAG: hypothetical protein A2898_03110 [Candidatus Kerfeldbacteria bacterium RIFCSPLOWO2_01_FULL_48_11]HCM68012.1 hypothetical protein [Candidatus Kerfeldbacteria bacterium]